MACHKDDTNISKFISPNPVCELEIAMSVKSIKKDLFNHE